MTQESFFSDDERFARLNISLEFARHPTEGHIMSYYRLSDPDNPVLRVMGPAAQNMHQQTVSSAVQEILREAARAVMYQLPAIEEMAAPSEHRESLKNPAPGG